MLGSRLSRGYMVMLTFIIVRAFAGRLAKNIRHVFEVLVKGLNLVVTSVRCFVIMLKTQEKAEYISLESQNSFQFYHSNIIRTFA